MKNHDIEQKETKKYIESFELQSLGEQQNDKRKKIYSAVCKGIDSIKK